MANYYETTQIMLNFFKALKFVQRVKTELQ